MKKHWFKMAAVFVLAFGLVILAVACQSQPAPTTADGLWQYTVVEETQGNATVKSVTLDAYLGNAAEVVVPSTIDVDGTPIAVKKVGDGAFMKIDDGKTKWRNRDTYAKNATLKKVTLAEGVEEIGSMSFYLCFALTEVHLPESLVKIGDFAFFGCEGLTEITLPKAVNSIGAYSFRACSALTTVNVLAEDALPDIGDKAFYLVDEKSSKDDQYYINKDLKIYVPEVALGLYDADAIEKERRQTKTNNHRYWTDYINAGCFPQLQ